MQKKYELISQNSFEIDRAYGRDGRRIIAPYRIKALIDIDCEDRPVRAGDLGGFVESEDNLSHEGKCWIFDNAVAIDEASVTDDATLRDNAHALDYAVVEGHADVINNAIIAGEAIVTGNAVIMDKATVTDNALVTGDAIVSENASVENNAVICDSVTLAGSFRATDNKHFFGNIIFGGKNPITSRKGLLFEELEEINRQAWTGDPNAVAIDEDGNEIRKNPYRRSGELPKFKA